MALQRSTNNKGVLNKSYENTQYDESGIELHGVGTGIYDLLEHRDCDTHTYDDVHTTTTTRSASNKNVRQGDSNTTTHVTISGLNVEVAVYKVIIGLLLVFTLLSAISGVIVYYVISAKVSNNEQQLSQHQDVAPNMNLSSELAMEIKSLIKTEVRHFNDVWQNQINSLKDNISQLRDSTDRRLAALDKDMEAVQESHNSLGCYDTRTSRSWELIFRATAGNGHNVYDAWTTGKDTTNVEPSSMVKGVSRHYRNTQSISKWHNVRMVKFSLFRNGRQVAFITFDGNGSTSMNWFDQSRVVDSSWCDIASRHGTYNYFSIDGHMTSGRRFFINIHFGGCPNDEGYIVVTDTTGKRPCPYESHSSYPQFLYSAYNEPTYWNTKQFGKADYMAIFYKHD